MPKPTLESAIAIARRHSRYVCDQLERAPSLLNASDLGPLDNRELNEVCDRAQMLDEEDQFKRALRLIRHHQLVRIVVRDFAQIATLDETLSDTSDVADALIRAAYGWAYRKLVPIWGTPIGERSGTPQDMIVLGMGKLGGRELNFSSDIDLIFVFPEAGETRGGETVISNEEFFIKLGRLMNRTLTANTELAFAYRVDMRLRPFGSAGQLAQSFESVDLYFKNNGRPWERHAMVKARAITGKAADILAWQDLLAPFVYRPYVDFSMLDSLRDLKKLIADDLHRKGNPGDLKLGAGGIRDVEFIVQSFQLIHGGRDHILRRRSLIPALSALANRNYLEKQDADDLLCVYRHLRRVENHVQMWDDQQTHCLPEDQDQLDVLAQGLGYADRLSFLSELAFLRGKVEKIFEDVFRDTTPTTASAWKEFWHDPRQGTPPVVLVDEALWREHLISFRSMRSFSKQGADDRARLDIVMPLLLEEIDSVELLKRILQVMESVLRRSVYLVLLKSSATARSTLITICNASPWLTETLAETPALMDQLLNREKLFTLSDRSQLVTELKQQIRRSTDAEHIMTVLRLVKQTHVFKVAANDLVAQMPLSGVSDHLTWIAEAVVEVALDYTWKSALARHGLPAGWTDSKHPPFLIIGFGKLGGLELGYGSDLDMVFLSHDALADSDMSAGPAPLEGAIYVTKMGQKLISLLSTVLVSGMAYEVDSRLRPHGGKGMLLNTLEGFFEYEYNQAWIWEHQAMIRTRAVAGHPEMRRQFELKRSAFLSQKRDKDPLLSEVLKMRQKMMDHLDQSTPELFDLKQGKGGIIDLEFLVQYLILRHAHDHPEITQFSANIRQLNSLALADIITKQEQQSLTKAYLGLRSLSHRIALSKADGLVKHKSVSHWQKPIIAAWEKYMV